MSCTAQISKIQDAEYQTQTMIPSGKLVLKIYFYLFLHLVPDKNLAGPVSFDFGIL